MGILKIAEQSVGGYRVIFVMLEQKVLILRIGHRRDIYKN